MLKVLQLIPTLDRSGAEKQIVLLARGLPRDRFAVEVAALTRLGPLAAELDEAGIPITLTAGSGGRAAWAGRSWASEAETGARPSKSPASHRRRGEAAASPGYRPSGQPACLVIWSTPTGR